jgi:hypothetical protein
MRCLRDVNVDHNTVGWYQSTYLGSFVNPTLVQTQFNYQQDLGQQIVVVYGVWCSFLIGAGRWHSRISCIAHEFGT